MLELGSDFSLLPLQWIRSLNPRVVLLAELDANLNGPFFLPRYRELLRLIMAMLQCTDAAMPETSLAAGELGDCHPFRSYCKYRAFAGTFIP